MAELRALSTRATITPTRFQNFYTWGDFRGQPATLMERYFDVFVDVANWGTHTLMLRLPRSLLGHAAVAPYCTEEALQAWTTTTHLIVSFRSQAEYGEDDDDGQGWMASLLPLRTELAQWRSACAVPRLAERRPGRRTRRGHTRTTGAAGLGYALGRSVCTDVLLALDSDLLQVAAHTSPALAPNPSRRRLARWIDTLSEAEKTELLVRLVADQDSTVGLELRRRFHEAQASAPARAPRADRRTVAELLGEAERQAEAKRRVAAERAEQERARRERMQAAARATYLDSLVGREDQVWQHIEALVTSKQQGNYVEAVRLVQDLHDVAAAIGQVEAFGARLSG